MTYTNVLVEKKDLIGFITLNRPEEMNTFNIPFARELNDALWEMDKDPEVRVVVIRGAGKHFSTGISLAEFKNKSHKDYREFIRLMDEHNHTIAKMKKPVIASVKGYALANGSGLSFACDLTVAADDAKFGTTAINVGLICLGPAAPLARNVGRKKTLEMVLTGRHSGTGCQTRRQEPAGLADWEERHLCDAGPPLRPGPRLPGRNVCCSLCNRRCWGRGKGISGEEKTRVAGAVGSRLK
jgi:enoyl-CoA hydratase/carnithine racemase